MVIFRSCADNLLGGDMGYVVPHPKFWGIVPPLDYARALNSTALHCDKLPKVPTLHLAEI